ncbi:MAG: helix-turn-helix domain-containing protein [Chitinophagaceae bacterium]
MNALFTPHSGLQSAALGGKMPAPSTSDFVIQSFEWLDQDASSLSERASLYEIFWFKSGIGKLSTGGRQQEISEKEVYCFIPGQKRSFEITETVTGYRIGFSYEFLLLGCVRVKLAQWLDLAAVNGGGAVVPVDIVMQHELTDLLLKMQREFNNYLCLRFEILSGLLGILLLHFSRKLDLTPKGESLSRDADLVRQFRKLLRDNLTSKKQVSDYANELCVTPNYLNRTVKRLTGSTASHHIHQQIIQEAKRQAAQSNVSMKEIAYFLGFDNIAHFSKFFKNNTGMNFTSFKRDLHAAL